MRVAFFNNVRGMSTPQLALIASTLAIASLIGVRMLEAPLGLPSQVAAATEAQTDLERLARAIRPARGRRPGSALPVTGPIDFTPTANSAKRTLQPACHDGVRTVSLLAPAGGPPMLLTTCALARN